MCFFLIHGVTVKRFPLFSEETGFWNCVETMKDYGDFHNCTKCILCYYMAISLWGMGSQSNGLKESGLYSLTCLNSWSPVNRIVWERLGVWPCWRRCGTGDGFWGFQSPAVLSYLSLLQAYGSRCELSDTVLVPSLPTCCHALAMLVMDSNPLKPQADAFFYILPWLWHFTAAIEKWLRQEEKGYSTLYFQVTDLC